MPLVLELTVLMLLAYVAGIGIGWFLWGSSRPEEEERAAEDSDDGDNA